MPTIEHILHFLLHTDAGLLIRVVTGAAIFTTFALIDVDRNGAKATRWREYFVLLIAVVVALFYGAINDQVTVTISPEYFIYGKELEHTIGENPPMSQLRWEAAKVGLKATWSAGLIFGVALLIANNPYRSLPMRLRNRQLLKYLPIMPITAAVLGVLGGWLGYHGYLTRVDSDFQMMIEARMYRPYRFMSTWGVHLGGYAGGVVGTTLAVMLVVRHRKKLARHPSGVSSNS